ncbi:MAG: pyridoxamine 5'-phosphate oxidase family protein [Pseudomonadota bacterium]
MPFADALNDTLRNFIETQHMFFVATAGQEGRVNVSPKGLDTLRVLGNSRIVWLNLTGSGNETAAHVLETGRMTLMFCAFSGKALILRVYGSATMLHPRDAGWEEAAAHFPPIKGSRQIFDLAIQSVQTSCGKGVPFMDFVASRGEDELLPLYDNMGPGGVEGYWQRRNDRSIDGKPTGIVDDG